MQIPLLMASTDPEQPARSFEDCCRIMIISQIKKQKIELTMEDAAELIQDCMLRAVICCQRCGKGTPDAQLMGYVKVSVRGVILDYLNRTVSRRRSLSASISSVLSGSRVESDCDPAALVDEVDEFGDPVNPVMEMSFAEYEAARRMTK